MQRFTTSDGIGIAYRTWADDAAGPPVLLHHGYIADGRLNWKLTGVVDALVAAGRRVVAHDARGHGRSDTPHDPGLYGEARMARDVSELADQLGLDAFDLAGYSMGGVAATITATQEPRVRRLVIGGIGSAVVEQGGVDTSVMDRSALADALEGDDPGPVADPGVAAFLGFIEAVGGDRLALAAQARAVHRGPIALDRITAPTLLLVGADDPLAARPGVLSAAIPDCRLEVIPGDHMGVISDPAFAPAIVSHLAG